MAKYAGIGTQIALGLSSPPSSVVVQVGDIKVGALTAKTYEATTHDNSFAGYSDFIVGLKDGGEVTFPVFFDSADATHKDTGNGLIALFNSGATIYWKVSPAGYSPAVSWTGTAVMTKLGEFTYPVDGIQASSVTLKIKGKPTHQ